MEQFDLGLGPWPEIDWQSDFTAQTAVGADLYSTSFSPTTMADSETSTLSAESWLSLQSTMLSSKPQILRLPSFKMTPIIYREHTNSAAQRISQLMLHTLKSYPLMMIRQKNVPPFYHPSLPASVTDDCLEPWNNCMSLVCMASSKIPGCRKLFWNNVRGECTRFCERYLEASKWELLATMQSLAIYVIMRLDKTAGAYDGSIDGLLLRAVIVISVQLMAVDTACDSTSTLDTTWENWIFEESRRRLCVLFQIVNMVVSFEPAKMCEANTDIILAPLPAQKRLWEAPDQNAWKYETGVEPDTHSHFGLTKDGQLVKLSDNATIATAADNEELVSTSPVEWTEWCSGMDCLGNLVMLAASLRSEQHKPPWGEEQVPESGRGGLSKNVYLLPGSPCGKFTAKLQPIRASAIATQLSPQSSPRHSPLSTTTIHANMSANAVAKAAGGVVSIAKVSIQSPTLMPIDAQTIATGSPFEEKYARVPTSNPNTVLQADANHTTPPE
ncbi:hypothetical protein NLG97_g6762 [Lecanicillium saksenae]|uniref:Uncharacterized protein n=1 Tax=Lecanicillium saksenae TaxID=468837 RepID=A0ACC1QPA2_9HYPO|nr:hypothetical protein NLG97_g6762 [Lecanicillium saksenae]